MLSIQKLLLEASLYLQENQECFLTPDSPQTESLSAEGFFSLLKFENQDKLDHIDIKIDSFEQNTNH